MRALTPATVHHLRKQFVWWALLAQLTENTKHVFLLLRKGTESPFHFCERLYRASLSVQKLNLLRGRPSTTAPWRRHAGAPQHYRGP
jgi:hypothetical protein